MNDWPELTERQRELADLMSDLSEDCWCAGWMTGTELSLWSMVQGGARNWGMGEVSAEDVERLRRLSAETDGWVIWDDDAPDHIISAERFVPTGVWLGMYEQETKR